MSGKKPIYHRVLLKMSGEALLGNNQRGICPNILEQFVSDVIEVVNLGVQVAIVIGGGNIFRGRDLESIGMDRSTADYIGMLSTVMNALAIRDMFQRHEVSCRVQCAIEMRQVAESYIPLRAIRHLEHKRVVVFACGLGVPYFSTDTAGAQRALEINAQVLIKATRVDGVYDKDPEQFSDAVKYDKLSYDEALSRNLKVLDAAAFGLCREHHLPMIVFNLFERGALAKIICGEPVGTIIT